MENVIVLERQIGKNQINMKTLNLYKGGKMKLLKKSTHCLILTMIIFPLLLVSLNLSASPTEVPITTNSVEALNLFLEGREKFEDVEFTSATALFDEAIQKDPNFAMAHLYRSQSGIKGQRITSDMGKAKRLAERVSEGEKHMITFYILAAKGKRIEQKEHLDRLSELYPKDKRIHYLAGSYFHSVDPKKALEHYQRALELDDEFAPVHNLVGYVKTDLGNYEAAEEAFKKYIELIPDNPNSYDSYAGFLMKTKRYDESILNYRKALEIDPSFSPSLFGITESYILNGEFKRAREYCVKLYENSSHNYGKFCALFIKALSYVYEGRVEEAILMLNECCNFAKKENVIPKTIMTLSTRFESIEYSF